MDLLDILRADFAHEAKTTRRHLERIPADNFDWRPHEKSTTAGKLGSHLVDCIGYAALICTTDGFNVDLSSFKPFIATSPDELLAAYDRAVEAGKAGLEKLDENALSAPWRFSINGNTRFERPRALVLRDFCLNHLIHHRGQMSVYLRLMDVAVPGTYGPSADERF